MARSRPGARSAVPVAFAAVIAAVVAGWAAVFGPPWISVVVLVVAIAFAVLVLAASTGLLGIAPGGPVARTGAADEVVVATFNVRNGRAWDGLSSWPFRARSTARTARDLGADVLAVQEAYSFQVRFLATSLPGYEVVGRGRGPRGGERCSVFVRSDRFRVVSSATRWFGDHPHAPGSKLPGASFPRIGTHVRMADRSGGGEWELVNTHLDERDRANRIVSLRQLATWLDREVPQVVVGDMNATWTGQPDVFAELTSAGLSDALPDDAGGTSHGFRGGTDGLRIDHILVSPHWEVVDARVVSDDRTNGLPSDHWPVVARLRLR